LQLFFQRLGRLKRAAEHDRMVGGGLFGITGRIGAFPS
jgi:hypothetical protein